MACNELTQPSTSTSNNISRRDLIKSVIAAGAVSSASYLFRVPSAFAQASAPGAVERLITLNVNGQQRRVDVMKQETLATTLRYKLGLTGTKIGCDRAECGACTVLVDDVPHYACSMLTHTVRGKNIVNQHGAGAAFRAVTPDLRASEAQFISKRRRQSLLLHDVDAALLTINVQRDQPLHRAGSRHLGKRGRDPE
jgi:hypothetical protein